MPHAPCISIRPSEALKLWRIHASLICCIRAPQPLANQELPHASSFVAKHILEVVDCDDGEREPIGFVPDRKFEGCVNVALLLVASDMHELLAFALVRQTVHEPWVGVEVEDDGPVVGEDCVVLGGCQAVRVIAIRHQLEQVDHIHESDLQFRQVFPQKCSGSQRLLSHDITARCHDEIRLDTCVVGSPLPDTETFATMSDRILHVQELQVLLLIGDDDVDVVDAAEAVVHGAEQAVAVWWEVDPNNFWALVRDDIKEAGILVGEAVVICRGCKLRQKRPHSTQQTYPVSRLWK